MVDGRRHPGALRVRSTAGSISPGTRSGPPTRRARSCCSWGHADGGGDLDAASDDKRWTATAHQRFERLLAGDRRPVGLLTNGKVFRIVYAPKGESAGWVDFRLDDILTVDGRRLLGALHMFLNERRLLTLGPEKRLAGSCRRAASTRTRSRTPSASRSSSALRELLGASSTRTALADGAILGELPAASHLQEVYSGSSPS